MRIVTMFLAALALILPVGALAAPPVNISYTVGVCDPNYPKRCAAVAADGTLQTSGSGGGGGATTIADGADVTQGAKSDLAATSSVGSFSSIQLLKAQLAAALDPTPVSVKIDQTTPGTTNAVQVVATVLPPGAAIAAKQATLDASGAAIVPQASTANRVLTATTLAANTNATVCPAATNPVTTELFFTTAAVGFSVNGVTLTSATPGTSLTASPDIYIANANTLYTFPVGPTNAITAYGAAGVVRCIQTLRQ